MSAKAGNFLCSLQYLLCAQTHAYTHIHPSTHNTHTHTHTHRVNSHVLSMAAEGWPKSPHPSVCVSSPITCEYSSLSVPWVTATILCACNTSSWGHHQHVMLNCMASSSTHVTLNHTADDESTRAMLTHKASSSTHHAQLHGFIINTCHAQPHGFIINTCRSTKQLYQHITYTHTAWSSTLHTQPHSFIINTSCSTTWLYHQHVMLNHSFNMMHSATQLHHQHIMLNHIALTWCTQLHSFISNVSCSTT